MKLLKAGVAAAVLGTTSLAAVQPAQAHDDTGIAVAAGILGLGVGAVIASDHPHYRQVQYDYYQQPQVYYQQEYSYRDGYGQSPDWQRQRYWEQRRWQEARQRQWERQRWEHRGWHHYDDDDDGY
ncbi:MAG: hypothetical protein JOY99_07240 [Sphingomonadaceae bacterium]|nr:hypothetical protein [Sphingomonadaceae bacterium]